MSSSTRGRIALMSFGVLVLCIAALGLDPNRTSNGAHSSLIFQFTQGIIGLSLILTPALVIYWLVDWWREKRLRRWPLDGPILDALTVPPGIRPGTDYMTYIAVARVRQAVIRLTRLLVLFAILFPFFAPAMGYLASHFGFSPFSVFQMSYGPHLTLALALCLALFSRNRLIEFFAALVALVAALPIAADLARIAGYQSADQLKAGFDKSGFDVTEGALLIGAAGLAAFVILNAVAALMARRRMRVLLLRPFGQPRMTRALQRIVVRHLGPVANVYTLSDRHYRPSVVMASLTAVGLTRHIVAPLVNPSLRVASVRSETTYKQLAITISSKLGASFKNAYSGAQAFDIRTTDVWWQRSIAMLVRSSNFIVMDISRGSAGSTWEIWHLRQRNMLDQCIFIVQQSQHEGALKDIEKLWPAGFRPRVHVFNEAGHFLDEQAFADTLQAQMRKALSTPPRVIRAVAASGNVAAAFAGGHRRARSAS